MTPALRDFRASAHYAAIEACLNLGPRGLRNSGATSFSATHAENHEEAGGDGREEHGGEGAREKEDERGGSWRTTSSSSSSSLAVGIAE